MKTPEFDSRDSATNIIINGDMRISQRGASFVALASATYCLDRWLYSKSGSMVHTVSEDSDVPTVAQAGHFLQNSMRFNLTTPDTSIGSTDYALICQRIEGAEFARIAQKPFVLSFWVKATLPGIYCIEFANSGIDRSFVREYTINASNTWEF